MAETLALSLLPERLAVCRLAPGADLPAGMDEGGFFALTRTPDELSIVCEVERVPPGARSVGPWRCLKVAGPLDFALTGVLAGISGTLAQANISLFALSTFDTDYILVREPDLDAALHALASAGYRLS